MKELRDWYTVHAGKANLLMADGSMITIKDLNGDGFFNPGFPVDDSDGSAADFSAAPVR